jgi:DNA-binding transcriptional regulator YhcF (GntR family)
MATTTNKPAEGQNDLKVNVKKWGRELIEAGWTLVPNTIIERQKKLGLDPLDLNILLHLMSYWWEPGNKPRPSKRTVAEAVGRDPRTVQRRIAAMEKEGLISRERRHGSGRSTQTNRYHLDGLIKAAIPLARETLQERKDKKEKTGRMGRLHVVK